MDMVRQKFADRLVPSKVLLKYMDEDDDLITLTNQMDVDDFFQMNLENLNRLSISSREGASNMTLRLYVEGTDEDAEYKCTDSSLWTPQGSWSTATRVKGLGHWPQSLSQSLRLPSPPKSEEDLSSGLPEIRTQSPVPEPRKHSPEPRKHSPELSPCLKELVELESNCGANPRSTRRKKRNVSKCSTSDTEAGFPNAGQFLSHHLPERPSRQWSIGRLLGSGACAKVYRGMYTDNGQLVAVKQVEIQKQDQQNPYVQEDLTNLDREISSLRTLDHPMIVRYLGMEIDEREDMDFTVVNIFMELVGGASIACLLSEMGPFSEQVCQSYTCQILIGLGYLHDNDIVHRDIKGANIMVDRRGNIKLTDFGAAKRIADMLSKAEGGAASNLKGTIKWMAPEVCLGGGGSKASDVWSLGCTVVEMATGGSPFPDNDNQFSILFNIGMGKCDPLIPKSLSQAAQDFLQQCFQQDPSCRPTVASLKRHEWLSPAFVNFSQETLKSGDEKMKRSSDSSELSKVGSDLSWDRLSHIKPWQVHVRVPRYCTDSDSSSPQNRRSPFNSSNSPLGTEVSSIIASNESLFNTRQSMVSADCSVVVDQEALAGRFDIGQTFIFGAPAADCVRNSMESVSH
jgi:serine/threonine protein kinase